MAAGLSAPARAAQPSLMDLPYGSDPKQRLDVYLPAHRQDAPVIVMVHGGGWRFGDKSQIPAWRNKVEHWTGQGIVVVTVNYRLLPQAHPLEQARDVARALAYVQRRAAQWGASAQRLVLMGHSAGGHLVSLLSADPAMAWQEGAQDWLATVALDSAALDPAEIMRQSPSPLYAHAFGTDPSYWEQASPLAQLQPTARPMLLVCSSRRTLPCPQAERFAGQMRALGGQARTLPVDLSHRSINAAIGLHPVYTAALDAFLAEAGLWAP
ncbi:MAG: esterase [Rhodobacteraceae bacterium]|nr:esterase [Paracoccaceae bacterium]MBT25138.1 esterase [Paracoccaceae bacterium]